MEKRLILPNSSSTIRNMSATNSSSSTSSNADSGSGEHSITIELLYRETERLGSEIAQVKNSLSETREEIANLHEQNDEVIQANLDMSKKSTKLIDAMFWVITIPVALFTLVIIGSIVSLYFFEEAKDTVTRIVGFLGVGGFISLAIYIRKLASVNKRIEALENAIK